MQFVYSELVTRFQDVLGTPKLLVEETFNKPDATDVAINKCVSIKNFGEFYALVIFEMDGQVVRFMNAYRIYPQLFNGTDISRMKPTDILKEFMNTYGISKTIPGVGECKFFVDRKMNIFFPGILDIEKYLEAVKNIRGSNS